MNSAHVCYVQLIKSIDNYYLFVFVILTIFKYEATANRLETTQRRQEYNKERNAFDKLLRIKKKNAWRRFAGVLEMINGVSASDGSRRDQPIMKQPQY